jgi:hypothetical protein
MPPTSPKVIRPAAVWVVLCAFLTCAGWVLSLAHQLNAAGYSAVILCGAIAATVWLKRRGPGRVEGFGAGRLRRRLRRWWPRGFLALAALTFLGGVLHPPTNYDALAYRVPRILNWLAEGQWHWIHTEFQRLNVRATGIEWISAPLIALTHSDRLLFLINTVSFLLLPGLIFSVFTRLGVRPRAAWHWMWLTPTGYCFLLQAGSVGNDLFGAVFGLAALDFALRAKASGQITDVWLSCLSAALLTGGKSSNFPLLLPVAVALIPSVPLILKRLVPTMAVGLVAAGASFIPTAALNVKYCGDWSGNKAEQTTFLRGGPALHVAQNCALLLVQNFVPPIFPVAGAWNKAVLKIMPPELVKKLEAGFEPSGAHLAVGEMVMEEDAGLGFGVSVMLLLAFVGTRFSRPAAPNDATASRARFHRGAILASAVVALLPYLAVSGASTAARLLTPYYCLIVPLLLLRQTGDWIRRNAWWRRLAGLMFLLAILMVVISPARPLWPARFVLSKMNSGNSRLLQRAESVYAVYGQRAEGFAPIVQLLPDEATVVGLISFDDPETSLWRPFGHRRIVHLSATDSVADARQRGVQYILASGRYFATHLNETVEQWRETNHLELVRTVSLTLLVSSGPSEWVIARLPAGEGKNP